MTEYGGPQALCEVDLPLEPLGPEQVRIRVTAAAVSPADTVVRAGLRSKSGRPLDIADVPGMDIAGVVTEIGEPVDASIGIGVGERVMGALRPRGTHGGYREDIVLPVSAIARVPKNVSDVEAATLPMNGLTARLTLDRLALTQGQVIAVTGAAGTYGGYVVQLAKADGLTVVADASEDDEDLVRGLGADFVVPRGDDVANRILERFPGGVDGLADGSVQNAAVLPAVRDGGAVATVRGYEGDGKRSLRVFPIWVNDYLMEHAILDYLRVQVERGELTLRVAAVFPAERASEAHRRLAAGGVRGRMVLTF